jgi:hypothetical protein
MSELNRAQRSLAWVVITLAFPFVLAAMTYRKARLRVWAWTVTR